MSIFTTSMKPAIKRQLNLTESEFWNAYFIIQNLTYSEKLTSAGVKLAAALCAKPLNFYLDTSRAPKSRSKYADLAVDTELSETSVYRAKDELLKKKVLIKSTDGFLEFGNTVKTLRKAIKQGTREFDYIFEFTVE